MTEVADNQIDPSETEVVLSPGRTAYAPGADDTVQCPDCSSFNPTDALNCSQCGEELPDDAFAAAAHLAPTSKGPSASEAFAAKVAAVRNPRNT
jgi:DNA-directed RNA polymerase subunit RPC12/RpoP